MPITTPIFQNVAGTPTTPQFAEIVLRGFSVESDGGNKPFVNVLHFVRVSGPGTGLEIDLLNAFMGAIELPLEASLSVAYQPATNTCRFMDNPINIGTNDANSITGTVTGDRLPNFNAVVVRLKTPGRGRSYNGSNHWGPIAESQTLLDNLTAGGITLWDAFALALFDTGSTGLTLASTDVWKLAIFSPTLSNYTASPAIITGAIVQRDYVLNKRIGTMKRRKDKTGPSN